VIPTALHRLLGAEHFLDGRPQRFGPIDDKQILAVGG